MWLSHDMHDRALAGFRRRGFAPGETDVLAAVSCVGNEEVAGCLSQRIGNQPAQGATRNKISTQNIVSKMSEIVRNLTILNDMYVRFSMEIFRLSVEISVKS